MAHAAPSQPVPTVQLPNPSKMKPISIILRPILPALLALSATLYGTIATAQTWGCFTPPPDLPPAELGLACGNSIEYAPLIPEQTPIKY